MSKVVLYHWEFSPFSRAVLQLCRYIKVDVEVKLLDLFKGEHMTEEYLALNPLHTVPFLVDGDFKLSESKAIMQYLMESRAPHLIAASPKERATINQRLMFEEGKVCAGYFKIVSPIMAGGSELDEAAVKEMHDILFTIDEHYFPNGNEWIANEAITCADFAYASTIAALVETGISLEKYPRIKSWLENCKKTFPDFQGAIGDGAKKAGDWAKSKTEKSV